MKRITNEKVIRKLSLWFVIVILLISSFFFGRFTSPTGLSANTTNQIVNSKVQSLNKNFSFSVKDASGNEITKLSYQIVNASLQYSILINGQKAVPVKGKVFLIINIQLTNSYDKNIQINSRDYVRLQVNNKPDLLAPDLHNDPVEVDAISTKLTRIGFAINQTDKNIKLLVGEIDGSKTTISLAMLNPR